MNTIYLFKSGRISQGALWAGMSFPLWAGNTADIDFGVPEEPLDLGSFQFPINTGDDWGTFSAPLAKTTDLGNLAIN